MVYGYLRIELWRAAASQAGADVHARTLYGEARQRAKVVVELQDLCFHWGHYFELFGSRSQELASVSLSTITGVTLLVVK